MTLIRKQQICQRCDFCIINPPYNTHICTLLDEAFVKEEIFYTKKITFQGRKCGFYFEQEIVQNSDEPLAESKI